MATQEQPSGKRAARLEQVDGVVRGAGEAVAPDHPFRDPLRRALDGLRHRLREVHSSCERSDDDTWADYVDRLDRGLDEMAIELSRVGEVADTTGPERVLFVHTTRLEIDGWVLRLDHAREGSQVAARELTSRARQDLVGYERGETGRADVERIMAEVRGAAAT